MKANLEGRQAHRKEEGRVIQPLFSRRFMKWSATIIGTFFQSTRTDQNSSWEFYKISWCQIEPFGLGNWTKKVFPFFSATYNTGRDQKVPPFSFFRHCATFFRKKSFFPKGTPSIFDVLRQWRFENPKGSPFSSPWARASSVGWVFRKCFETLFVSLILGVFWHFHVLLLFLSLPGRPSMDILVRSWQDLAKILENS